MSDLYDGKFGFHTFKKVINQELGKDFWNTLSTGLDLKDIDYNQGKFCYKMHDFMERFDKMVDKDTACTILSKVRHGLHPSQCAQARVDFLEIGDLDKYMKIQLETSLQNFVRLNQDGKDFYGDMITDEVLEFLKQHPDIICGERKGDKLYCRAFPANMSNYLKADDEKMKRYYACHCIYAKESILSDQPVSSTLCYCSLGHVKNFWEAVFDQELKGEVIQSVLAGDLQCRYVIYIPEDIMKNYVKE